MGKLTYKMNTDIKNDNLQNNPNHDEEDNLIGSKTKKANNLTEPDSHLKMRSFIERCPLFVCAETKNKLTKSEIQSFYEMKEEMNVLYDSKNSKHEDLLKELYKICFINEHTVLHEDNINIQEHPKIDENSDK